MDTFERLLKLLYDFGFPVFVAVYLLIRFEKVINNLSQAVRELTIVIQERYDIRDCGGRK